ncbi:cupin domain-containing protein [Leifsonia sp. 22587]|uniref:helix-turn-helix domain-containing protein n=1 Tax=Leifsonia sp. 22587 TaxID=3453946 RepID=UPI003F825350
MDDISRMLRMARLEATLDKRCLLGASTTMVVQPGAEREVPFHVLLEGELKFEVGGRLFPMVAGDVIVLPAAVRHRVITSGSLPARGTVETAGATFTRTSSAGGGPAVIDLFCGHYRVAPGAGAILFGSLPTPTHVSLFESEAGRSVLLQLSALMRAEAQHDGAGSAAIMSALCTVLIALVLRTSASAGAHRGLWTAAADGPIADVIQRVVQKPGDSWSIAALARDSAMSRATFIRRFQAATGTTFGRFLVRTRLMWAADLLAGTDLTVSTISSQVGYRSESAFTRAFREEVGVTPARFRRAQRSEA